jgi:amino acid adenylation domain-containing protein
VVLTQRSLVSKIPADTTQIICLDTDSELINAENPEDFPTTVQPENLVYAIYTSGSTGQPKAVLVEHRQLTNYLYGIVDQLNLSACMNFATVSSLAADLGNTVIFPALFTGGCLHIISTERAADSQALAEYCQRHPIDCLKIVPSHLSALLASSFSPSILPRQCLILGGEASSWNLIEQIQQQSNCQIFNHYGPTETTVGVLTYPVTNKETTQTVPLGRPLANTQIYILDEQLQPVPIGVPGELYIGGTGIARGYLNQPELTAKRFIKNPFASEPTARLYKTGDIARYLSNGNLEFLGRVDNQVKIRGFRVELGEIEAVLRQHSDVQEVIVLTTEQDISNQRLVAYIVPNAKNRVVNQSQQVTLMKEIRSFCGQKLPDYMIPAAFVFLKALPLTANGKVDRQALPAPDQSRNALATEFVSPRTPTEQIIAEIWTDVLGQEKIGIYDNFFDLGGHSLLATQIISRLRTAFKIDLPVRSLFENPTVITLVERIEGILTVQQLQAVPMQMAEDIEEIEL